MLLNHHYDLTFPPRWYYQQFLRHVLQESDNVVSEQKGDSTDEVSDEGIEFALNCPQGW